MKYWYCTFKNQIVGRCWGEIRNKKQKKKPIIYKVQNLCLKNMFIIFNLPLATNVIVQFQCMYLRHSIGTTNPWAIVCIIRCVHMLSCSPKVVKLTINRAMIVMLSHHLHPNKLVSYFMINLPCK